MLLPSFNSTTIIMLRIKQKKKNNYRKIPFFTYQALTPMECTIIPPSAGSQFPLGECLSVTNADSKHLGVFWRVLQFKKKSDIDSVYFAHVKHTLFYRNRLSASSFAKPILFQLETECMPWDRRDVFEGGRAFFYSLPPVPRFPLSSLHLCRQRWYSNIVASSDSSGRDRNRSSSTPHWWLACLPSICFSALGEEWQNYWLDTRAATTCVRCVTSCTV